MFREILLSINPVFHTEQEIFREISITTEFPTSEKKWSKIEPDLQQIMEILQEENQSFKTENFKTNSVKFIKGDANGNFYFEVSSPIKLQKTKEIVLYKKQKNTILELNFELVSIDQNTIVCKPHSFYKSNEKRKYTRTLNEENEIYAKDFEVAQLKKNTSDYLSSHIFSIFEKIQKEYRFTHQNLELFYLYNSSELTLEEKLVALEQKPIVFKIINEIESYPGNFLDINEFYKKENIYSLKIDSFKKKRIYSCIIYPIFLKLHNKKIFIGSGYLWELEPKTIPTSDIFVFEEIENKINYEILANKNIVIFEKQEIINFSKGGILFKITNSEIAQAILLRAKFSAKICKKNFENIKLQFYARNIYQIEQDYYIGSEILGNPYSDDNIQKYINLIQERNT